MPANPRAGGIPSGLIGMFRSAVEKMETEWKLGLFNIYMYMCIIRIILSITIWAIAEMERHDSGVYLDQKFCYHLQYFP